jgi:beta-galactosidase
MTSSGTPSPSLPGLPVFPYGAVYFRKSNPPPEDWERDYATAAADGMTVFRHWFLWSAIQVGPDAWDWEDYDRQLDLAARYGLKTICAEHVTAAPEWAWRAFAHARLQDRQGVPAFSRMNGSSVTGGSPGLCLDHDDARAAAERFLTTLARRYRGHPGLAGYDVWNECNIDPAYCYCPATAARFRAWLREKYGDVREVGRVWHRHSYAAWEDVQPPRQLGPYPEVLDWLQFRLDNAYRLLRWRVDVLRAHDPQARIVAHGIAASLHRMAAGACDEWRAAAEVEAWGYTWGSSRHGDEPWKQWHAVDLARAGARGKPIWHAEAYAGPLWLQPNVLHKPRDEGRIAAPKDVRLWGMQSFAAGATGLMYLRWRPLLDGPLFGAFGAYGLDGSRTPRSEMAASLARWVADAAEAGLWQARPVQGDIGIAVVPESQLFCYAQQGTTDFYAQSAQGAYQGFFEHNAQPDWVHIDDIERYGVLYLPYPVHLSSQTASRLRAWVEAGGVLVSEGCPAYWGDRGRVGTVQPNLGLHELFGAREAYVEFTPDILTSLTFVPREGLLAGQVAVPGGVFLQAYAPSTGTAVAHYAAGAGPGAGAVAAVEPRGGRGKTLLTGTFPGYGHHHRPSAASRAWFGALLDWAGVRPHVRILSAAPQRDGRWWGPTARIHAAGDTTVLWVTNPHREELRVELELAARWTPRRPPVLAWGSGAPAVAGPRVTVDVPGRDAVVLRW